MVRSSAPRTARPRYEPTERLPGRLHRNGGHGRTGSTRSKRALDDLPIVILNPRRDEWNASWTQSIANPQFREQVEWELNAQEQATIIGSYFAPATKAPITLLELGLFARSGKLIVCCPDGYWRKGNVEVVCAKFGVPLAEDFADFVRLFARVECSGVRGNSDATKSNFRAILRSLVSLPHAGFQISNYTAQRPPAPPRENAMSRLHRTFLLINSVSVSAAIAFFASASASEAFYAMLPLGVWRFTLTASMIGRSRFRRHLARNHDHRRAVRAEPGGGVFVPRSWRVLSWRFWIEIAGCLYYLAGALLALHLVRRGLLAFAKSLEEALAIFARGADAVVRGAAVGDFRWLRVAVRDCVCERAPLQDAGADRSAASLQPRFRGDRVRQRRRNEPARLVDPGQFAKPCATIIICHGIAANRSLITPFVEVGDWLDANVLMFDLRGHGESGGRSVTLGFKEKDDVLAAIAFARHEHPGESKQLIGMGVSLGAACFAEAAAGLPTRRWTPSFSFSMAVSHRPLT